MIHYSMSEIESKISPQRDAEKNYEVVKMLKTENDDDGIDIEKGPNKNSEDRITLRRDFFKKSTTTFLSPIIGLRIGLRSLNFLVVSPISEIVEIC